MQKTHNNQAVFSKCSILFFLYVGILCGESPRSVCTKHSSILYINFSWLLPSNGNRGIFLH